MSITVSNLPSLQVPLLRDRDESLPLLGGEQMPGTGLRRVDSTDSLFVNSDVEIRQSTLRDDVQQLREESRERLGQPRSFGSKVLNIIGTILTAVVALPLKIATTAIGTVGGLVLGALMKGFEFITTLHKSDEDIRAGWRDLLGGTRPLDSVLNQDVDFRGDDDQIHTDTVENLLDQYRLSLGGDRRVSREDMLKYVVMGERIVRALENAPPDPNLRGIEVDIGNGETLRLDSNVETTRAISWYLQAKALRDNSGDRPLASLTEGAMVAKDPGNRLYNFLSSSDNAYGRVSSHMQERSESVPGGWSSLVALWEGGFTAMLGSGLQGQPLQHGIEDFDNRMPSKGGTLLFDRLKSSNEGGEPEIYLKWESGGMPNSMSLTGTHANLSLGDKLWNRGLAFFRCLGHTVSFAGNADPEGYRGEKMEKGEAGRILTAFSGVINGLQGVDPALKQTIIDHAKKYGATEMNRLLDLLIDSDDVTFSERHQLIGIQNRLDNWMGNMGEDLGIERKGAEVHVSLT